MQNPDKVEKLVILNTPLGLKTKLRPELAAYKNRMAFLRPDPKASPLFLPTLVKTALQSTSVVLSLPHPALATFSLSLAA